MSPITGESSVHPLSRLKGVGPGTLSKLARLGIETPEDLAFHLPLRYQNRTAVTPIGALRPGQEAVVEAEILAADLAFGRRRSLLCRLSDNTGLLSLRLFHFSKSQQNRLTRGQRIRCFGQVRRGASGMELYHPEYQLIDSPDKFNGQDTLTPVYPTTEGFSQARWRQLIPQGLELMESRPPLSLLPANHPLVFNANLVQVLRFLHLPPVSRLADQDLEALQSGHHPAQRQLAFEELTAHQLGLRLARQEINEQTSPALQDRQLLIQDFIESLPYRLTGAQARAFAEIQQDLQQPHPMQRLLQGDVGAGKTLVATLAALLSVSSGYQAALMAPTEILAEQHFNNLRVLLPKAINMTLLTGKLPAAQRRHRLMEISEGQSAIIIGTHALFQKEVEFKQLGLVIIDEQHRFGVQQRLALTRKSDRLTPHQLVMTATPIPRTMAMFAYADLDQSILDEKPPGRTPVETLLINGSRRSEVVARIAEACAKGQQAYWVCTLIEESEALQCQAAEATFNELQQNLRHLRLGLIHGRLSTDEKSAIMQAFKAGNLDLLIATTVIEVGVDVPNASLMVIENPERLGLAQLHQLRGRVGRGQTRSYCLMLYQEPLTATARQRLSIMRTHDDGFVIAEKDLAMRGPGEFLGTRQAGQTQLRFADLERDQSLIPQAQQLADQLLSRSDLAVEKLLQRWVGHRLDYARI